MTESDTFWLAMLKGGQSQAASELWERYFSRLVGLARRKLASGPRRVADEEDVALSAFHSFCRGAGRQQFARLDDSGDLWQVLAMITSRKAMRQMQRERAQKRGGANVRGESVFMAFDGEYSPDNLAQWIDKGPDPHWQALINEAFDGLLDRLEDPELRDIALWKLEGYTNAEIARKIDRNVRSIERKLKLIRMQWSSEAPDETA